MSESEMTPPPKPKPYVVRVNECRIHATRGMEWWTAFRLGQPGRCAVVSVTIGGALVDVACADRDHADNVVAMFYHYGIPPQALTVRKASVGTAAAVGKDPHAP